MSRTYRRTKNIDHWWYYSYVHEELMFTDGCCWYKHHDTNSKYYRKYKAEWHSDGWCSETSIKSALKQHSTKWRRAYERNQLSKVYRQYDYNDAEFDCKIDRLVKKILWFYF